MTQAEIRELLRLKDWSSTDLGAALQLTAAAVNTWLITKPDGKPLRKPSGPASILMRQWLTEARVFAGGHPTMPIPASIPDVVPASAPDATGSAGAGLKQTG